MVNINGIYYKLNLDNNEAILQHPPGDKEYSGDILIPEYINHEGVRYIVTTIEATAFCGCDALTSVVLSQTITSIGIAAFSFCSALQSIVIPKSVEYIEDSLFEFSSNVESIIVEEGNSVYDSRDNCNAIIETRSNTLISGCKSSTIPYGVVKIGDTAFYGCLHLTAINIPSSVIEIGLMAFSNCSSLLSINIPNGVISIGEAAFENCNSAKSIYISESVENIEEDAFYSYGKNELASIIVHPENRFYDSRNNCNAIIESASNTLIYGCRNSLIPLGVERIGARAFHNCKGKQSIVIPRSVKYIGNDAFYNSDIIEYYFYSQTPPEFNLEALCGFPLLRKLYVPLSSLEDYRKELYGKSNIEIYTLEDIDLK